mgnify:CR=1 FL=1
MKITEILVKEMTFRRRKVFKIAFSASMYARGVYVKVLTDELIMELPLKHYDLFPTTENRKTDLTPSMTISIFSP